MCVALDENRILISYIWVLWMTICVLALVLAHGMLLSNSRWVFIEREIGRLGWGSGRRVHGGLIATVNTSC
jgi:hypothetical protein